MRKDQLNSKHSLFTLGFLILVFVLPLVAAHLLYAYRNHFHFSTNENGKLLSPPIASQGLPFFDKSFLGKWQLIYFSPIPCDTTCKSIMPALKQIHTALGKEKSKVEYRMIDTSITPLHITSGDIVIIDPQGWLILQYASKSDLKGILRDLRQLLRISHA